MKYNFNLTEYKEDLFIAQICDVLKKHTELFARKQNPKVWNNIDKLNSRKVPERILSSRKKRCRIYGVILILLGFLLYFSGLLSPLELVIQIIVGTLVIALGLIYLHASMTLKSQQNINYEKSAKKLYKRYENLTTGKAEFTDNEIILMDIVNIKYGEVEGVFVTNNLYVIIWSETITVLQKKDLVQQNEKEFLDFINSKIRHKAITV